MKLKVKPTDLDRLCKVLDSVGVQYMRASVKAQDQVDKKEIETTVLMFGGVFEAKTGKFMFAVPVANPIARNHSPTN